MICRLITCLGSCHSLPNAHFFPSLWASTLTSPGGTEGIAATRPFLGRCCGEKDSDLKQRRVVPSLTRVPLQRRLRV